MPIIRATDKKNALLAFKEKLLNDIKYYEKRINDDSRSNVSLPTNFEDSSDSENECPFTINNGPMANQLRSQQKMLQTGLHATQELASLTLMQSEVTVMVEDPILNREPSVNQPGLWREVHAECRIDLVSFATSFYVHQANGLFGAKSYRGLKVLPVKPAHEAELTRSVLARVTTPSDAVEVLRSYSVAHRSRRTTLARLADKFTHNLYMEPMREGGYLLKCANLLEISWVLENKWSSVAPFYHKMIFDLENMGESYIKIIKQAHKQLGDPSTDTNQRTLLLAKIIATCLEVQGTQELYESMESDTESVNKIEKRRLTLENEAPEPKKMRNDNQNDEIEHSNTKNNQNKNDKPNNKDSIDDQMMAPPKSLPKKGKPKGKENSDQNRKSVKRATVQNEGSNVKKARTDTNDPNNVKPSEIEKIKTVEKDNQNKSVKDTVKNKDKAAKTNNTEKSAKTTKKDNQQVIPNARAKSGHNDNEDNTDNVKIKENVDKTKNSKDKVVKNQNNVEKVPVKDIQKDKAMKSKNQEDKTNSEKGDNEQEENVNDVKKNSGDKQIQEKAKKKVLKDLDSQKLASTDKKSKNNPKAKNTETKKIANDKIVANSISDPKTKSSETQEMTSKDKIIASPKNNPKTKNADTQKESGEGEIIFSSKNDPNTKKSKTQKVSNEDKVIASSKIDLNTKDLDKIKELSEEKKVENNSKTGAKNVKVVEIDDIPIMSVNNNIGWAPRKDSNNDRPAKHQKGPSKSGNANERGPNKDAKKVNKLQNNAELANMNRNAINKDAKTQKSSNNPSANNAASKNDKLLQKNSTNNKAEVRKTVKNNEKVYENEDKTNKVLQKTNTQKLKDAKQKDIEKNKVTKETENLSKNQAKIKNNNENPQIAENQQPTVSIMEKLTKFNNVATKNKEQIANIINLKEINTKIGDGKPKLTIKNLSHKNFAASKKARNLNISGKIKNLKCNIIANKNSNSKENDSGSRISKIPMKAIHESLKKKNPLRLSPRKLPSTFKSSSESNMKQKTYFTNIPRLTKPGHKKMPK